MVIKGILKDGIPYNEIVIENNGGYFNLRYLVTALDNSGFSAEAAKLQKIHRG